MAYKNKKDSDIINEKKECKSVDNEELREDVKEKNKEDSETKAKIEAAQEKETEIKADKEQQEESTVDTVEDLKKQLDSMNNRYLRLMAEFDNFKKRTIRDYERLVDSANEKLILELVDVRENFERALKCDEANSNYQSFFDGIKLIFNKFDTVLCNNGLESFAEPGDEFDPQDHDAMMKMPHETIPEGHIGEIYEKGYRLKGKVIKHAKVIVSSGNPECPNEESKNDGDQ